MAFRPEKYRCKRFQYQELGKFFRMSPRRISSLCRKMEIDLRTVNGAVKAVLYLSALEREEALKQEFIRDGNREAA